MRGMRARTPGGAGQDCYSASACCWVAKIFDLLTGGERHDGLLPAAGHANLVADALGLAAHVDGVDLEHVDVEELLNGLGDLLLGSLLGNLEGVLALLHEVVRTLGDHGADDDVVCGLHYASTSSSCFAMSVVMTRAPLSMRLRALASETAMQLTFSRLRKER